MNLAAIVNALRAFMQQSGMRAWLVSGAVVLLALVFPHAKLTGDWIAPNGILELQLAGTRDGALTIIRTWTVQGKVVAATHAIWWDFLLIPAYAFCIYVALRSLSVRTSRASPTLLDRFTAGAIWAAAGCDVLENAGMLFMLGAPTAPAPEWLGFVSSATTLASLAKWTLLFLCTGHLAWLLLHLLMGRPRGTPEVASQPDR
jgi:hypothetical protein